LALFGDKPLYRLLPPAYAALWRKWAEARELEKRAPEQAQQHDYKQQQQQQQQRFARRSRRRRPPR